jgi:hypothetical protein
VKRAITLVTGADHPPEEGSEILALFECAPDSVLRRRSAFHDELDAIIGVPAVVKEEAYRLSQLFLAGQMSSRSVRLLGVLEELMIRDLSMTLHHLKLFRYLKARDIEIVDALSRSSWAEGLSRIASHFGDSMIVNMPASSREGRLARSFQRLKAAHFSRHAVRAEWRVALERLDPAGKRFAFWPRMEPAVPPDRIWFYSTAQTYSLIGMQYERYFPEPFEYLVENAATGGAPLKAIRHPFRELSSLSRGRPISATDIEVTRAEIRSHLSSVRLNGDDSKVRDLFLTGAWYREFEAHLLPLGMRHRAQFEAFMETCRPKMLVVGNPTFEGFALDAARACGIPTVLLQHGVLGDYCQLLDPPVDRYIVRGTFWRNFLATAPRARATVANVPVSRRDKTALNASQCILYISAPYHLQGLWHPIEQREILIALARASIETGLSLVIRIHPLESVAHYQLLMKDAVGHLRAAPHIEFSQGDDEDAVVARAVVAILHSSTLFLKCLAAAVPIVSLNWHDFSFKPLLTRDGVFYFANDLAHLYTLAKAGAQGQLAPYPGKVEPFLADTSEADLRYALRVAGAAALPPVNS